MSNLLGYSVWYSVGLGSKVALRLTSILKDSYCLSDAIDGSCFNEPCPQAHGLDVHVMAAGNQN